MFKPERNSRTSRTIFLCLMLLTATSLAFNFAVSANRPVVTRLVAAAEEMEELKPRLERADAPSILLQRYNALLAETSTCTRVTDEDFKEGRTNLIPANNLCLAAALGAGDPTWNRPTSNSTGSGLGGACTPSGSATGVFLDRYSFNLFGCTTFPTVVTISLCGPAGCTAPASFDSVLVMYRQVSAGDPLTANGGLPGSFTPSAPCTNARALNDDTGATPTSTGGSTCNQTVTSDCTASCSPSTSLSQMKRNLGSGIFTVAVTSFSNGVFANYNLYVNAPGAGCQVSTAPTASDGVITGRVMNASGIGVSKAAVQITDQEGRSRTVATNPFGYYQINDLETGQTYVVTVTSKQYVFVPQVIELTSAIQGVDFTATP